MHEYAVAEGGCLIQRMKSEAGGQKSDKSVVFGKAVMHSRFSFPASDIRPPTSDLRLQTSDFEFYADHVTHINDPSGGFWL